MKSTSTSAIRAREARVNRGLRSEREARAHTPKASLQGLMQLPLLEAIEECGGRAKPGEVYERLAQRLNLSGEALAEERRCRDGQAYKVFEQQVRWARQTAVMQGLIANDERGIWELADPAYQKLLRARRGTAILIYSVDDGLALWAHAEDAASVIEKGSVSLICLSPPYPSIKREYGTLGVPEWLSWMKRLTLLWKELLAEDGTLAVNLMDCFVPGTPTLSPYVERYALSTIDEGGYHLAGRQIWHSPTKLGNIQWTGVRKVQPRSTTEHILLFSKSANPNWDINRMPRGPVSKRSAARIEKEIARGRQKRPSGYDINAEAFYRGNAGPLPGNLIVAGGASGADAYSRRCREHGVTAHPARYPEEVPRRIISLTTEPGQTVYDPMAGSNTTGMVALALGRRFIASDAMLSYVQSSAFRFDQRPDYTRHYQR